MQKILTIADREFRAMVGTRAFVLTIALMPLLMLGGIAVPRMAKQVQQQKSARIIVVDQTSQLAEYLELEIEERNDELRSQQSTKTDLDFDRPYLEMQRIDADSVSDEDLIGWSDQIRAGSLYAVVQIPADVLSASLEDPENLPEVRYFSQDAPVSEVRRWLQATLSRLIRIRRFIDQGVDSETVVAAESPVTFRSLGLVLRQADGSASQAVEADEITVVVGPFVAMMLMFMVVFLAAQPILESVLEEKSQRIAEVLLGSVSPFELMAGKLLGNVAGSLSIFSIYILGAFGAAHYLRISHRIPFEIVPWFFVYQILAVLFFSSIFLAIGASVGQLKEAQTVLMPVWFLLMTPLLIWPHAIREPNSAVAVSLSMFPPATPMLMVLRLSTGATIPMWQPLLGGLNLILATWIVLWCAARIFEIGILWQGKSPRFRELIGWIIRRSG